MVDGLDGLGHDPVVGRHHEDHDVGDLGAAGPHGREGLVARRVDERDAVASGFGLVRADVLGDPARFTGDDVGVTDAVEQERLAVVDVAHDRHDRRAGTQVLLALFLFLFEVLGLELGLLLLAAVDETDLRADLGREQLDHVVAERLGGGDHLALEEQEPDHVPGRAVELGPELARRGAPLHDDLEVRHGRVRRRVGGELCRLELLEVPTTPAWAPLGRTAPSSGPAPQAGRRRTAPTGTTAEATAATGTTTEAPAATGSAPTGGPTAGARATHPGTRTTSGSTTRARSARRRAPPGGRRDRSCRWREEVRGAAGSGDPTSSWGAAPAAPAVSRGRVAMEAPPGRARRPGRRRPRRAGQLEGAPRAGASRERAWGGPAPRGSGAAAPATAPRLRWRAGS